MIGLTGFSGKTKTEGTSVRVKKFEWPQLLQVALFDLDTFKLSQFFNQERKKLNSSQ